MLPTSRQDNKVDERDAWLDHDRMAAKSLRVFFISSSNGLAKQIAAVVERFNEVHQIKKWLDDRDPGSVTKQILGHIHDADVIIADLSSDNPNVYYELGIAHTLGRPTVLFKLKDTPLPFDVHDERAIEVEVSNGRLSNPATVETDLGDALQHVRDGGDSSDTAIQQYLRGLSNSSLAPDGWRAIAAGGGSKKLLLGDVRLGTWVYEDLHGLGEIVDVSLTSNRTRLRIRFANGSAYRELYYDDDVQLYIAPEHVQAWLRGS